MIIELLIKNIYFFLIFLFFFNIFFNGNHIIANKRTKNEKIKPRIAPINPKPNPGPIYAEAPFETESKINI